MIEVILEKKDGGFQWIDLAAPTKDELYEIAEGYGLPSAQVTDCLHPENLPKLEVIGECTYVILRAHTESATEEDDTIQEVTDKIAIFFGKEFMVTVHRASFSFLTRLKMRKEEFATPYHLLFSLYEYVISSFDQPLAKLARAIDVYEPQVFLQKKVPDLLKDLYFIKRRAAVIDSVLNMSKPGHKGMKGKISTMQYNHVKDEFLRVQTVAQQVVDDVTHLLNIYISISAQRTNEVMRVLTVFSVFFLPLTFIAGLYGMNFAFMPELHWTYGYLFSILLMTALTLSIYLWFRRKGWL